MIKGNVTTGVASWLAHAFQKPAVSSRFSSEGISMSGSGVFVVVSVDMICHPQDRRSPSGEF